MKCTILHSCISIWPTLSTHVLSCKNEFPDHVPTRAGRNYTFWGIFLSFTWKKLSNTINNYPPKYFSPKPNRFLHIWILVISKIVVPPLHHVGAKWPFLFGIRSYFRSWKVAKYHQQSSHKIYLSKTLSFYA